MLFRQTNVGAESHVASVDHERLSGRSVNVGSTVDNERDTPRLLRMTPLRHSYIERRLSPMHSDTQDRSSTLETSKYDEDSSCNNKG